MVQIDEQALQVVIDEMAIYRPDLSIIRIRQIVKDWLKTGHEPLAETTQDVVWSYQRALERLR